MAKQMKQQAIYPKRRLYYNQWWDVKGKHIWESTASDKYQWQRGKMWQWAGERHTQRSAFGKWLRRQWSLREQCKRCVVLMVRICHYIPDTIQRKPDIGAATVTGVLYNTTPHKNERHGMIAAAGAVSNLTRWMGNGLHLIHRQWVRGAAKAVRAVRTTRVFLMGSRFVANTHWGDQQTLSVCHPVDATSRLCLVSKM